MADWDSILIVFFNSGTAILGSCANLLIIISFFVFNSSRQPTEILLINLSLADFLVCAGYQPLLVLKFKNYGVSQVYMSFIGHSVITASMTGLLAVNFDHFSAIYFPYKYITWMTEKNTISLVTISWMISLSAGLLIVSNFSIAAHIFHLYISLIIVLVPLMYSVIYREARKQARRIVSQTANQFPYRNIMVDRATRGVGLVLITTLTCWLPGIVSPAIVASLKNHEEIRKVVFSCLTAICANSCINPFIYVYKFSKFRRSVRKLIQRILEVLPEGYLRPSSAKIESFRPSLAKIESFRHNKLWKSLNSLALFLSRRWNRLEKKSDG